MKRVLVLGCTGSIGTSTLDVVREFPDEFKVCGLAAHTSKEKTVRLAAEFNCPYVLTSKEDDSNTDEAERVSRIIRRIIEETKPDIAVNGIAGSSGLVPSAAVIDAGVDLALANKETVVMAWPIIKALAQKTGSAIIPVDSEHSALFNLLQRIGRENVSRLVITASGGPFRDFTRGELTRVTVEAALKHPTWSMGKKITIDSATLANKGLEVIEACRLFDFPPEKVQVAVHPQSIVHSLVRTLDGMLYAQLSVPDMRHPILGALSWPKIANADEKSALEQDILSRNLDLTFTQPRMDDFPMLPLAYNAIKKGGAYTIAYNAANEAVANAFMAGKIGFTDISEITKAVLQTDWTQEMTDIKQVMAINDKAQAMAEICILLRGSDGSAHFDATGIKGMQKNDAVTCAMPIAKKAENTETR